MEQQDETPRDDGTIRADQWRAWAHLARRSDEERWRRRNKQVAIAVAMLAAGLISYYLAAR